MSGLSESAQVGILLGCVCALYLLVGIIERIEERHEIDAEDHQELPVYRGNSNSENNGQDQGVIPDNGQHLTEEDDKSFDEDARTIVGEENESNTSKYGVTKNGSQGLTEFDGQKMTEKDKESFDGEGRTITGEEKDTSSVDLTEKGYSEECYGVPKDDGQHSTRTSLGEGMERTSVDLNKKDNREQR